MDQYSFQHTEWFISQHSIQTGTAQMYKIQGPRQMKECYRKNKKVNATGQLDAGPLGTTQRKYVPELDKLLAEQQERIPLGAYKGKDVKIILCQLVAQPHYHHTEGTREFTSTLLRWPLLTLVVREVKILILEVISSRLLRKLHVSVCRTKKSRCGKMQGFIRQRNWRQ